MKTALLVLILALPVFGQSLPDKPVALSARADTAFVGEIVPDEGGMPTYFSDDFVLKIAREDGRAVWEVVPVNSCEWCGRPITFKRAMFDKRSLSLWVTEFGLTVADTEITHAICPPHGALCGEANPFLFGSARRSVQYGVRLPVLSAAWISTAMLRKGNKTDHIGGMRHWWLFPAIYQGEAALGIAYNLARRGELSSR